MFWKLWMKHVKAPARRRPYACLNCVSYMCLTCCSDFVQTKMKETGHSFSFVFISIEGYSCLGCWIEVLESVFQVWDWSFLISLFCGNVCNWILELISSQMDWFWSFLFEFSSWLRLRICGDWNLRHLLNFYSYLTT